MNAFMWFTFGFAAGFASFCLLAIWLYVKDEPGQPKPSAKLDITVRQQEPEDEADWWKNCDP